MLLMSSALSLIALVHVHAPPAAPAASGAAAPAAAVQPVAAPDLLRFSPESIDFGEMVADKPSTKTVTVTNVSGGPLQVESIKGSCGCTTVAGAPTGEVPAGGSFEIQVTVRPRLRTNVTTSVPVHFALTSVSGASFEGRRAQSLQVKGFVKRVVSAEPEVVDLTAIPSGSQAVVTLESVDKGEFSIVGVEPAGLVDLPKGAATEHRLSIDLARWGEAGHPASFVVLTDKPDGEKILVMVRSPEGVVLYRLPSAPSSAANRAELEAAQDEIIRAIDERLGKNGHSSDFNMRLHRETGMLFVHGTPRDADLLRNAVKALPADTDIREAARGEAPDA